MNDIREKNDRILLALREAKIELNALLILHILSDLKYIVGENNYEEAYRIIMGTAMISQSRQKSAAYFEKLSRNYNTPDGDIFWREAVIPQYAAYISEKLDEIDLNKVLFISSYRAVQSLEKPNFEYAMKSGHFENKDQLLETWEKEKRCLASILAVTSKLIDSNTKPIKRSYRRKRWDET